MSPATTASLSLTRAPLTVAAGDDNCQLLQLRAPRRCWRKMQPLFKSAQTIALLVLILLPLIAVKGAHGQIFTFSNGNGNNGNGKAIFFKSLCFPFAVFWRARVLLQIAFVRIVLLLLLIINVSPISLREGKRFFACLSN